MASYPDGVVTRAVSFGKGISTAGALVGASMSLQPVFPGTDYLLWTATGDPYLPFADVIKVTAGQVGTVDLPVTDQEGWADAAGNAFRDWYYRGVLTYQAGTSKTIITRGFQLPQSGGDLDFDTLLSTDQEGSPVSIGPTTYVKTVNGHQPNTAGDLTLPGVSDMSVQQTFTDSAEWFVSHALGRVPNVAAYAEDGHRIFGDENVSDGYALITWPTATSGTIVLN